MPYIVSPTQGQPGWGDYLGQGAGKITDLLLRALLSGQIIPKQAGGTQFSQAGQGQGFSMAPTTQNAMPQTARPQAPRFGGFQLNQVPQQLQQLKLQQAQQQLNPQSPLNQFLVAQSRDMNSQADQRNRQGQPADASASSASSFYHEGDVLERSGKRYKIVGFDTDGMPLVEEE